MILKRHNDVHYLLEPAGGAWLVNLYPGNGRVYGDRNRPERGPYLALPERWTLRDAVLAAAQITDFERHAAGG